MKRGRPRNEDRDAAALETLDILVRLGGTGGMHDVTAALGCSRSTAHTRLTRLVTLGLARRVNTARSDPRDASAHTKFRKYDRITAGVGFWHWKVTFRGRQAAAARKIPKRSPISKAERELERARHALEVQQRRVEVADRNVDELCEHLQVRAEQYVEKRAALEEIAR